MRVQNIENSVNVYVHFDVFKDNPGYSFIDQIQKYM